MSLFDEIGLEQTLGEISSESVVPVMLTETDGEKPVNVSDYVLSPDNGTEGNQFEYTGENHWRFKLQSKNYAALGA